MELLANCPIIIVTRDGRVETFADEEELGAQFERVHPPVNSVGTPHFKKALEAYTCSQPFSGRLHADIKTIVAPAKTAGIDITFAYMAPLVLPQ
jgi:hypothetical protein